MRVHENGRAIIVRGIRLHAPVRKFRLAGGEKSHHASEIIVGAHQNERADVRGVARIARRKKRKSARETHSHDGYRSGAEPLLQPVGGFPDGADRSAIDAIVGKRRDLRREDGKSVAGSRSREIHEAGLVDPEMMNPVNENHARRVGDAARHVQARLHRALRRGKCDLLRIQFMAFQAHEKAGCVRIKELNQKGRATQVIA